MDIPFSIRRVFYRYCLCVGNKYEQNANIATQFLVICVAGKIKINIIDNRGEKQIFYLDCPYKGVYIPKMTWKEIVPLVDGTVFLALASEHCSNEDCIYKYDKFIKEI